MVILILAKVQHSSFLWSICGWFSCGTTCGVCVPADGLNSFSFSPGQSKGSFQPSHHGLDGSWAFYNYVGQRQGANLLVQNPTKPWSPSTPAPPR
ncbi:PASK [Cordylochernes scorpioides]|uniref:PASK n=1 Tax=Cordylochernes scorpioides TaxID=51811 RepID=A0ABY6JZJ3_9ARAC|nr:PASK [Cordylochernes scorpioides]